MSKLIKKVTVTSILNSKTGVKDFRFVNESGTHASVYVESIQEQYTLNLQTGSTYRSLVKRGTFIGGPIEDMANFKEGQTLDGKIIKISSYKPFYEGQSSVINPTTGEVVLHNGREYYIKFAYDATNSMQDLWLQEESDDSINEKVEVVDETQQGDF